MAYATERDLKDMDNAITELEDVIIILSGVVEKSLIDKLKSVVSEWDYAREHVVELIERGDT
jgi:hypothetical protein